MKQNEIDLKETAALLMTTIVDNVAFGYDPLNSADMLQPDDRFFLTDPVAEEARRKAAEKISGLPNHVLDYLTDFIKTDPDD